MERVVVDTASNSPVYLQNNMLNLKAGSYWKAVDKNPEGLDLEADGEPMDIDEEPTPTKNSPIGAPPTDMPVRMSSIWWRDTFNSLESAYLRDGCDPKEARSYARMCMSRYNPLTIRDYLDKAWKANFERLCMMAEGKTPISPSVPLITRATTPTWVIGTFIPVKDILKAQGRDDQTSSDIKTTSEKKQESPPPQQRKFLYVDQDLEKKFDEIFPNTRLSQQMEAAASGIPPPLNSNRHDIWALSKDKTFTKYFRQVQESNGFDFDQYPGGSMYAEIYPMTSFNRSPEFVNKLKRFASEAIKQHYGVERNIKEILKVNAGGCGNFHYYITFTIDKEGGIEETFQAEVVTTIEKTVEYPLCRRAL